MLSKDLETTLNEAFRVAKSKRHEFMTVEHLLLALLDNDIAIDVLNKIGADIEKHFLYQSEKPSTKRRQDYRVPQKPKSYLPSLLNDER